MQLDSLRWKKIVKEVKTKNMFDCRNKIVQILQVLFRNNESLDESLVAFFEAREGHWVGQAELEALEVKVVHFRVGKEPIHDPEEAGWGKDDKALPEGLRGSDCQDRQDDREGPKEEVI